MYINYSEPLAFYGLDDDPVNSLKKYGLVCRNEKSDQYMCIYKVRGDIYDYSFLCESDIKDLFGSKGWFTKEQKKQFFDEIDQTEDNFLKLPFIHKTLALISHFDVEEIMGVCFDPMTYQEAKYMMENEL